MPVDQTRYRQITGLIIDQLEGGYYHPDMLLDGRVKDTRYKNSGETMFGIDRKAGGAINTTAAGKYFWSIIDNVNARKTWAWNYMGGNLNQQLKDAAADIMYPEFDRMANLYLSPKSKAIVESDDRLLFNFIYATWNGSGWFKRFANDFNDAVDSGVTNTDQLVDVVLQSRADSGNSLIVQGGKKIAKIVNNFATAVAEYVKKNPGKTLIVAAVIAVSMSAYLYFVTKKMGKN